MEDDTFSLKRIRVWLSISVKQEGSTLTAERCAYQAGGTHD